MEFRTVVIRNKCKLSYKDGYLIVRGDEVKTIHISEIHSLVIETTMATVTKQSVDRIKPGKGLIQVLVITEKQYASIDYLLGEPPQKQITSTDRLVIL